MIAIQSSAKSSNDRKASVNLFFDESKVVNRFFPQKKAAETGSLFTLI